MPTLDSYRKLAPFSLEELVAAVNSILREKPLLAVQARTVRYYISQQVIPPPAGSPRFARYDIPHLLGVVATRVLQDDGLSLETARGHIEAFLASADALESVQALVDRRKIHDLSDFQLRQPSLVKESQPIFYGTVVKIPLAEGLVLECSAELTRRHALETAAQAISDLLTSNLT